MQFSLQILPLSLQETVLKQVRIHEALKLLTLTRNLRLFFLKNGPFPQKLNALEITFSKGHENEIDSTHMVSMIFIQAEPHGVPNRYHLSSHSGTFEEENSQIMGPRSGPLFSTIRSCKSLTVKIEKESQPPPIYPPSISHHRMINNAVHHRRHMPALPPGANQMMPMYGNAAGQMMPIPPMMQPIRRPMMQPQMGNGHMVVQAAGKGCVIDPKDQIALL
ncbi:unnamed protein product, partial [Mesorhabditis belari]|uniref:Uncharacterized protein n=1 Tax=Mesorhabditis belari TaxID=2138241 RepID=A0AAF3F095_9BILA